MSFNIMGNVYHGLDGTYKAGGAQVESGSGPCKEWPDRSNEVWDELLSRYDIYNLDNKNKKKLANDLMEKGVISQMDRDRFAAMLNRKEEQVLVPPPDPNPYYDQKKYGSFSEYLKATAKYASFSSGLSETAKDDIFASFEFDHLINHLKSYADKK